MVLFTCPAQKQHATLPGPLAHPCGRARTALDDAGHAYEVKVVGGQMIQPWTWRSRGRDRTEVRELSGRNSVPILVLDDGEVVAGSARIARWAGEHPPVGRDGAAALAGSRADASGGQATTRSVSRGNVSGS